MDHKDFVRRQTISPGWSASDGFSLSESMGSSPPPDRGPAHLSRNQSDSSWRHVSPDRYSVGGSSGYSRGAGNGGSTSSQRIVVLESSGSLGGGSPGSSPVLCSSPRGAASATAPRGDEEIPPHNAGEREQRSERSSEAPSSGKDFQKAYSISSAHYVFSPPEDGLHPPAEKKQSPPPLVVHPSTTVSFPPGDRGTGEQLEFENRGERGGSSSSTGAAHDSRRGSSANNSSSAGSPPPRGTPARPASTGALQSSTAADHAGRDFLSRVSGVFSALFLENSPEPKTTGIIQGLRKNPSLNGERCVILGQRDDDHWEVRLKSQTSIVSKANVVLDREDSA